MAEKTQPPGYQNEPPPYQGYQAVEPTGAGMAATTTVYVPAVQQAQVQSQFPTQITCPNCQASVITQLTYKNGTMTYLMSGGMCLAGLWLGCCLIPFCMNTFKDIVHTCPNCNAIVGFCKRI